MPGIITNKHKIYFKSMFSLSLILKRSEVARSNSLLSSPPLSSDRLRIRLVSTQVAIYKHSHNERDSGRRSRVLLVSCAFNNFIPVKQRNKHVHCYNTELEEKDKKVFINFIIVVLDY